MLFTAISIDTNLPRKRKYNLNENEELRSIFGEDITVEQDLEISESQSEAARETREIGATVVEVDTLNPAKYQQTVTTQSYQNYKSALKW
jgi:hypothetical protein